MRVGIKNSEIVLYGFLRIFVLIRFFDGVSLEFSDENVIYALF